MREIKFRAWDEKNKKMYCFDLIDYMRRSEPFQDRMCPPDDYILESLMQFAEIKDKRGVEIYEGDILRRDKKTNRISRRDKHPYYIVKYDKAKFVTEAYNGDFLILPDLCQHSDFEVIGNIYQNKDLLQ